VKTGEKLRSILLLLVGLAILATGVLFAAGQVMAKRLESPPRLKVINRSGLDLENVILEGSGFHENLGDLPAGKSRTVTVHPRGESGLRLSFRAMGRQFTSGYHGYFESSGGYRVIVWIDRDLQVDTRAALFLFP
jgi:hypothetical protein